ncbi:ribonuclease P protein component [Thiovibrio sp. JS02]
MLLRKSWQYKKVYDQGRRVRGQEFSLIFLPNNAEACRLGISIHGVRPAVRRNRIKRVIREFFRFNRTFMTPSADVVFAARSGFSLDSPQEVNAAVRALLAAMGRKSSQCPPDGGAGTLPEKSGSVGRVSGKG